MPRLIVLRITLVLVMAALLGRLYQLQLVPDESRQFGSAPDEVFRRYLTVPPRRGEIFAADGTTLLAESMPVYNLAVVPGRLPNATREAERRAEVLARIGQVAGLSATLTISPSGLLATQPSLRAELRDLGATTFSTPTDPLLITVPPALSLDALALSRRHAEQIAFVSPIEELVPHGSVRGYERVLVQRDVPPDLALAIRENSNYLPGVEIVEGYERRYPTSATTPSFSHMLGYIGRITECELMALNPVTSWVTGLADVVRQAGRCGFIPKTIDPPTLGLPPYQVDDRIGKDGIEAAYEAELRGAFGLDTLLVDALQRPVSSLDVLRPVQNGNNLVLTVDATFQAQVEQIMRRWIAEGERRRLAAPESYKQAYDPIVAGAAVVLDPRDGRVLALVSLPTYDNNVWVDPARRSELVDLLTRSDPDELAELLRLAPLTNRTVAGLYPPGSTVKQFVGAAALQQGVIAPDTRLRDPGLIRLIERSGAPFELPNSVRNRDNGLLNVADALRLSSNVFFASIAGGNDQATNLDERALRITGMQINGLSEGFEWFHFGRKTGVDLAGELAGLVPNPTWKAQTKREAWTTGDTYNTAIGQGDLLVTPLQLAVAAGGVALDGTIYRPHVVNRIVDGNGQIVHTVTPEVISRAPVDPLNLQVIRQGMRDSVTDGLNLAARTECSGLEIAGKTGTAEFGALILRTDGRLVRQSHAWFVGFAPYDNPEVVVAVLIEGVGDLNDGSSTMTVPATTQIMQAYFGVTPPTDAPRTCPILPGDPTPLAAR
jgi:penicillin-binding protein 2